MGEGPLGPLPLSRLILLHIDGYPPSIRHAREGGHPGFLTGFPLKACGNDVLG
jgi:hypothetical protein